MAEAIYTMKKGTEFPELFAGAEIKFWSPDSPTSPEDWQGFLRAAQESHDDAVSAHAALVSAYNLDRQKELKDIANEEGMTVAGLQARAQAAEFRKSHRRLRGAGSGATRKPSGKVKQKTELEAIDRMIQEARAEGDEASVAFLSKRRERLDALLKQSAEAQASAPADAGTTPTPPAEQPKKGNKK